MKTKEELNALKEEVEAVNWKLAELTTEELAQITGGREVPGDKGGDYTIYAILPGVAFFVIKGNPSVLWLRETTPRRKSWLI